MIVQHDLLDLSDVSRLLSQTLPTLLFEVLDNVAQGLLEVNATLVSQHPYYEHL